MIPNVIPILPAFSRNLISDGTSSEYIQFLEFCSAKPKHGIELYTLFVHLVKVLKLIQFHAQIPSA